MHEISENIIKNHMVRLRKTQKNKFLRYMINELEGKGFDLKRETHKYLLKNENLIIGNVESADLIFTAHYDTPFRMLIMGNVILPSSIFLSMVLQIGFFLCLYLIVRVFSNIIGLESYNLVYMILIILTCFFFTNKNNYNDNTSGVVSLIEIAMKLEEEHRDKVAFVFFDNEEKTLLGALGLREKYKKIINKKTIVNFDCVGVGDEVVLFYRGKGKEVSDRIEELYLNNKHEWENVGKRIGTLGEKEGFFPSDHLVFENYVAVGALKKGKYGLYLDNVHTKKDSILEERNIALISDLIAEYINELNSEKVV